MAQSCRTCTHYGVPTGKRARTGQAFPCKWKMPDSYKFPDSIIHVYNSPVARLKDTEHHMGYREPNEGVNCATYEKKEEVNAADQG